jgi:transcription initiation factor IIE alpha subunit
MDSARKNFKVKERVKVMNNKTENIMRIIELLEVVASQFGREVDCQREQIVDALVDEIDELAMNRKGAVCEYVRLVLLAITDPRIYVYYRDKTEAKKWPTYLWGTEIER